MEIIELKEIVEKKAESDFYRRFSSLVSYFNANNLSLTRFDVTVELSKALSKQNKAKNTLLGKLTTSFTEKVITDAKVERYKFLDFVMEKMNQTDIDVQGINKLGERMNIVYPNILKDDYTHQFISDIGRVVDRKTAIHRYMCNRDMLKNNPAEKYIQPELAQNVEMYGKMVNIMNTHNLKSIDLEFVNSAKSNKDFLSKYTNGYPNYFSGIEYEMDI